MPSTDIDGTPILILAAPEIEFLAELMDDASIGISNSFFGRPYEPNETGTYKRMRKFLDNHDVMYWLDEFKDLTDAIICDDLEEKEGEDAN